jgi:DtxR family Mn-dependent transcriptional regulator
VLEKLYHFLGQPDYCQHGNPIPDIHGKMKDVVVFALSDAKPNQVFELLRVIDHKDLLIYLNQYHLKLHDRFVILERDDFNGVLKIEKESKETIILTLKTAGMLFGRII